MKKVILGFLSVILLGQVAVAQPVSDHAIIPMAITVQSIMRLNVKSGGNIEFVFSKISDITAGIPNSPAYDTYFDLSASQNWDVEIGTDNGNFTAEAGGPMPLATLELQVAEPAPLNLNVTADPIYAGAYGALVNGPVDLLTWHGVITNVGTAAQNPYIIHWRCGTNPAFRVTGFLGRYTVNVYLSLVAH